MISETTNILGERFFYIEVPPSLSEDPRLVTVKGVEFDQRRGWTFRVVSPAPGLRSRDLVLTTRDLHATDDRGMALHELNGAIRRRDQERARRAHALAESTKRQLDGMMRTQARIMDVLDDICARLPGAE